MKKRKILGGALLLMLAVVVAGNIYDRYPHAGDVKNLPKGKPVIVLRFQGAPPDDLQYLLLTLSYSASRPDDRGVTTHKSCNGFIVHLHPCSTFVDTRQVYPTGYIDRERGEISFPFETSISGPGDYRLQGFSVIDNKYRYVAKKNGDAGQDGDYNLSDRRFILVEAAGAPAHAAGFARHTDGAKNVLVLTRPGTFDIVADATVIPYSPDGESLHRALAELGRKKYQEPDNKPVGFLDRDGRFVMSAMTARHLEMGDEYCSLYESGPLRRALAKQPLFKKIEYAGVARYPDNGKDICDEAWVGERGNDGHRYLIRTRGNKVFARRSASGSVNYIDAMWVDKKLVFAFSLKQDRNKGDDGPATVRFLDDEFLKIYPDERKDFPAGELAQLELAVSQIMAAKASQAARGQLGAAP